MKKKFLVVSRIICVAFLVALLAVIVFMGITKDAEIPSPLMGLAIGIAALAVACCVIAFVMDFIENWKESGRAFGVCIGVILLIIFLVFLLFGKLSVLEALERALVVTCGVRAGSYIFAKHK